MGFDRLLGMETPQPAWATFSDHTPSKKKKGFAFGFWGFFFLTLKRNFLYFSLCLLPLILSLGTAEKFPSSLFHHIDKTPHPKPPSLEAKQSTVTQPPSYHRGLNPLVIFLALHWALSGMDVFFLVAESTGQGTALQVQSYQCR